MPNITYKRYASYGVSPTDSETLSRLVGMSKHAEREAEPSPDCDGHAHRTLGRGSEAPASL